MAYHGNIHHVKNYVTCNHVNVKFYHVKFEVIRKYFLCYVNLIFVLEKERKIRVKALRKSSEFRRL